MIFWILGVALLAPPPEPSAAESQAPAPAAVQSEDPIARLWDAFRAADDSGDTDGAARALGELARIRREKNIQRLEAHALALVGRGQERAAKGDTAGAHVLLTAAAHLDPKLAPPDAASPGASGSPLRSAIAALGASFATTEGRADLRQLLTFMAFLLGLGLGLTLGAAFLSRYAPLLVHDLKEKIGARIGGPGAVTLAILLLGLPVFFGVGWGFLPFWWAAVLFVYLRLTERVVVALLLAGCALAVPWLDRVAERAAAERNPLFHAARFAVDGPAAVDTIEALERAWSENHDDKDLAYLLASQYRKAGRDAQAEGIYAEVLRGDATDSRALNNLGNIEYSRGEYAAALARYQQARDAAAGNVRAVVLRNEALAHQQRFDFESARQVDQEAQSLAGPFLRDMEALYGSERGQPGVALDLAPTGDDILEKFEGASVGIPRANVWGTARKSGAFNWGAVLNRFAVGLAVFALMGALGNALRGKRRITQRCHKCGTVFCTLCNLGRPTQGLCTQCHHLFAVRSGVSSRAKMAKLTSVQAEERQREAIFRVLSTAVPGAGQAYAGRTGLGLALAFLAWAGLGLWQTGGRVLPVLSASLLGSWSRAAVFGTVALALAVLLAHALKPRLSPRLSLREPVAAPEE